MGITTSRQYSWFWFGIVAGISGGLIGFIIRQNAAGTGYENFPLFAAAAAFLCAAGFWWLLLSRTSSFSIQRGIFAGMLTGLFAHYLCWFFFIFTQRLCYLFWDGCTSSLGEPPVNFLNGLWAAGAFSLFSLLLFGWLTLLLGIIFGGLAGFWYRSHNPTSIQDSDFHPVGATQDEENSPQKKAK